MLDFIINPISGGVNGKSMKRHIEAIEQRLKERNVEYAFHFTEYSRHATQLTEQLIDGGATTIISVGGDGTLHEVINGFKNFDKVALGLLPCGTGNDFAAAIGLPTNPVQALDLIIDGTPKYTDFMQMPTVRGINIIGMGLDVDVLKLYNSKKRRNKITYITSLVKALWKFKYGNYNASVNGDGKDYRSFLTVIANGCKYGGGIPVCPIADPTDKQLNFITVSQISKIKIIGAFFKVMAGNIFKVKQVLHKTGQVVKILPENAEYTVNVDGELYDNIPFEVKIVSDTLRLYR